MPGPAIVQSDRTVLLEVAHPGFEEAREALAWPDFSYRIDQDPAIAAEGTTGSYIGIDGETLGLGLNVFGNDCGGAE